MANKITLVIEISRLDTVVANADIEGYGPLGALTRPSEGGNPGNSTGR